MQTVRKRPSYARLLELIDMMGGNLHKVADYTGYKVRQVNYWITEADPEMKAILCEALARARARQRRAIDLRPEIPAFLIPSEIKPLVSLYYRLPWDELMLLDIEFMLKGMDDDPEKPPTLRYKMEWADLKAAVLDLDQTFPYAPPGKPDQVRTLGGPVTVQGVTYEWWHQHILMHWIGLGAESPLFEQYDYPPEVMQDAGIDLQTGLMRREVIPALLEKTIRLLIQRLGRHL